MPFRKAVKNPNRRKEREVENWWQVETMDLEFTKSKKGDDMIVVNLGLEEAADEEYGINSYFLPFHKHDFPRTVWDNWRRDMKEATGFEIPSNSTEAIWASAGPEGDKWPMPFRVGVCENWREYIDETGLNRRVRNLEVVEWDFSGNGHTEDVKPPFEPPPKQDAATAAINGGVPTDYDVQSFWKLCESGGPQLREQIVAVCNKWSITKANLAGGATSKGTLQSATDEISAIIDAEAQAAGNMQHPAGEELPF